MFSERFLTGISFSGQPLRERGRFVVGVLFNPHVNNLDKATIEILAERTASLPVPIFMVIMPITSARNAEFPHNELPGIRLTDAAPARYIKKQTPAT
ncbi:MAG: hypothetical protein GX155_12225 [Smithella sp.]|jgi:homocysteine S-methyltransferase|nr:hypothetical protein [Smithella sp.]